MNTSPTPPPLPPDPAPNDQWAFPTDAKGEPKKKYLFWVLVGSAGCFVLFVLAGIASTLLVPVVVRKLGAARAVAAQHEMSRLRTALDAYALNHDGRYPETLEALVQPDAQGHTALFDERILPLDPWKHEFSYEPPSTPHGKPTLRSFGKDGRPGGTGEDADILEDTPTSQER